MNEALLVLDSSDYIVTANDAAGKLFGVSHLQELCGKHISGFCSDNDKAVGFASVISENRRRCSGQNIFVTADGKNFFASYSAMKSRDPETQAVYKVILIQAATDRLKEPDGPAAEVERLQRKIQEFDHSIYVISHDLKAPLRSILNLSHWIQEDLNDLITEEVSHNLNLLRSRVVRMEAMVNGLSEYAKIGSRNAAIEPVDVFNLIREVLDQLPASSRRGIDVKEGMPVLTGPKQALFTVFFNLIENAIKHNDKTAASVTVRSTEHSDCHEFTIEDNGPGIAPEYHERIFTLFQTLQPKDKVESIGIGLTLVKRILDAYGGTVRVEQGETCGSRFIFTWRKELREIEDQI